MKILIVEDHVEVLECFRSYFGGRGFEVVTACTVPDAIRLVRAGPLAMAFIDLRLPGGDGQQVVREIAALRETNPDFPMTRMVIVTADDDLNRRQELMRYGVSHYLFKPITIRDLEELVSGIMADQSTAIDAAPSDDAVSSDYMETEVPPPASESSENE